MKKWDTFPLPKGKSTISGAISGLIAGGVFGGIKHFVTASKIANSVSGIGKAQANLDKAIKPLGNVKTLSNTFYSSSNIASTVGNVANNVNAASTSYVNAQITQTITQFAIEKALYPGAQFLFKQLVAYQINKFL